MPNRLCLILSISALLSVGCGDHKASEPTPQGCAAGKTRCGGACVDLMNDDLNCSACGVACGDSVCIQGRCDGRCPPSLTECGIFCCVQCSADGQQCVESVPDAGVDLDAGPDANTDPDSSVVPDGGRIVPQPFGLCAEAAPVDASRARAPRAYSGGSCPALQIGENSFRSSGNQRDFVIVAPEDLHPDEVLPVIFMWHWLKGSPSKFIERGDVQTGANEFRMLAVLPDQKGDLQTAWPYAEIIDTDARIAEEVAFFDDMLSCVAQQFNVNLDCVSSVGVSAGALWTAQLVQRRAGHIANFISLSGGVGDGSLFPTPIRQWSSPNHRMPAIVLWGGPGDICPISFEDASKNLEDGLRAGGHFMIECIHNCGHTTPPLVPPVGRTQFAGLWEFALDHPFWLGTGESPYRASGLPEALPSWCAVGQGNAAARTGQCGPNDCQ